MKKVQEYREVLQYLSSIGIRAKNNEANKATYDETVRFIFECAEERVEANRIMYFLDCVAHNILGVTIFKVPLYEYNVLLEDKRHPKSFMKEYNLLKGIKKDNEIKAKN